MVQEMKIINNDGTKELSNENWEKFCQLYTSESDFFGNGVQAYVVAYDVDTTKRNYYNTSQVRASQLLKNSIILARINYLLDNKLGLNELFVDKQLAFLITQGADMRTKLGAIREYNALKGRIKHKLELSFKDSSDAEIEQELQAVEEELALAEELLKSRGGKAAPLDGMPELTDAQKAARASQEEHI